MKKFGLTLMLVMLVVFPMLAPANMQPIKTAIAPVDYLGYIEVGGVDYHMYGVWPDIYSVVPSSGTVTSYVGHCYLAQSPLHPNWPPNIQSITIEVITSNGDFEYTGPLSI